ncbi:hypothetical protein AVEN_255989-1 [Araneus ventricosus]|uniref:Uncharacterized protein n=1 Tax=Araneus ventricosus TaxID=182803 RepID=A0A4Y2U1S1_ARAVE|nr:hypothetical protein AVEN_255989-1 [Araneus ventricosus]
MASSAKKQKEQDSKCIREFQTWWTEKYGMISKGDKAVCVLCSRRVFVFNSTHPRKPLCSVAFGHIARGSGRLTEVGSKNRCEVIYVSLWEHGIDFLPRIPIQLTGNPLGFELGGIQWP